MVISLILAIPHVFGAGAITCTQFSQISRHVSTIEIIRKQRLQRNSSEKFVIIKKFDKYFWRFIQDHNIART